MFVLTWVNFSAQKDHKDFSNQSLVPLGMTQCPWAHLLHVPSGPLRASQVSSVVPFPPLEDQAYRQITVFQEALN